MVKSIRNKYIYLDNSATTRFKPDCVISAMSGALKNLSANPGRSGHPLSVAAQKMVSDTRKNAAAFFGALERSSEADRVIFTLNCTDALNLAILGTARQGGHVVTTALEHNSVLRPLYELERRGIITLSVVAPNEAGFVAAPQIYAALKPSTYMVAVTHISNVTGAINPILEIGRMLRAEDKLFLCDAAQSAGYFKVNAGKMCIDLLAIAGHKGLHGPQGIGALIAGSRVTPAPIRFGGTGTDSLKLYQPHALPESLESGTLPTPTIAGLNAALNFCSRNEQQMHITLTQLSLYLAEELSKIKELTLYSCPRCESGVLSFNLKDYSSQELCSILAQEYSICARGGLHCAPLIHRHLGTEHRGAVRISLSSENTYQEVNYLLEVLSEL